MKIFKKHRTPEKNQFRITQKDKEHFCPIHGSRLIPGGSQYGLVFRCNIEACDVVAWSGSTSTPATREVRGLRIKAHDSFDRLWKSGFTTRIKAYRMLSDELCLPRSATHIGHFGKEQLEKVISFSDRVIREAALYARN